MKDTSKTTVKSSDVQKKQPGPQKPKTAPSQARSKSVDQHVYLQRAIGNQTVQRLHESGAIQAKLTIGQPNDKYEQEADRIADQVMRMPEPQVQRQEDEEDEELQLKPLADQITPLVQRQSEPEEEKEEEKLQAKESSGQTPEVTPSLESCIQSLKGGGQPLPESTRAFFEPRFDRDFSQVRVHTDAQAAEMAQAINAKAFTVGKDIVFGSGQYSPKTAQGQQLLSHEMAHVIQQKQSTQSLLTASKPGDYLPYRREALKKFYDFLGSARRQFRDPATDRLETYIFHVYKIKQDADISLEQLVGRINDLEGGIYYHILEKHDEIAMSNFDPRFKGLYTPGSFYTLLDRSLGNSRTYYIDIDTFCSNHATSLHLAERRKHAEEQTQDVEPELKPAFGAYWDQVKEVLWHQLPIDQDLGGINFQVNVHNMSTQILEAWDNAIAYSMGLMPFSVLKAKAQHGFLVFRDKEDPTIKIDLTTRRIEKIKKQDLHFNLEAFEWRPRIGNCFIGIKKEIFNPIYSGVTWKVGCKKTEPTQTTESAYSREPYLQFSIEGDLNPTGRTVLAAGYVLSFGQVPKIAAILGNSAATVVEIIRIPALAISSSANPIIKTIPEAAFAR